MSSHPSGAEPPAGWALVRFEAPSTAPLDPRKVTIVGASSDAIGRYAQTESAKRENEQVAARLASTNSLVSADSTAAPLEERTSFFIVPSGQCERLRSRLDTSKLAQEHPNKPEKVYFRAATDGAGRVSSIEVLYTDASERATQRIAAFAQENLRVWSREKPGLALQFYGSLQVLETGDVSAAALAGSALLWAP